MSARVPADPDTRMLLGEMKAKIQELVHQNANRVMKDEATGRIIAKLEDVPDRLTKIEERLMKLEAGESQRNGERGVVRTLFNSPLVGWLAGFAVAVAAWLETHGK